MNAEAASWKTRPKHDVGKTICTKVPSEGERITTEALESLGIDYIREYWISFGGKAGKNVDLYLPLYKTFIEVDGIQHFETCDYCPTYNDLLHLQLRDARLDEFVMNCTKNYLLRISYRSFDHTYNILHTYRLLQKVISRNRNPDHVPPAIYCSKHDTSYECRDYFQM